MMRRYGQFGCLLAGLWLVLAMVGASPQLHHTLHEDASDSEHSCVIEYIGQGAFLFSPEPPIALFQPIAVPADLPTSSQLLPTRDFRVSFSRGPPAVLTSRTVAG